MRLYDEVSSKIVAGDGGPNRLLAQRLGWDGSGVTVAVADSGLQWGEAASMHPDLMGRTPVFFYYGDLTDAADEHGHGTHVTGIIAGDGAGGEMDENGFLYGLGVAPGVRIVTQRIFDGLGGYQPPPSFERLTRDAVRAGADIGSNSWGDDTGGRYDLSAMEFDELVRDADGLRLGDQPYILEFSAGNAGPYARTIGSPAVAKNVIATGATQNDRFDLFLYDVGAEAVADFSSRGPCEDGRIKPDLVAPGTWIASLQSAAAPEDNAWLPISRLYSYMGGTSQAGPHVTGAAALFVQFYRHHFTNATPSPALVKAALINTAVDLDDAMGTGPVPNFDEGWGRVNVVPLLSGERQFLFYDQTTPLVTGQSWETVVVVDGTEPLRITLVYTDVPGTPFVLPALVNDLDLEVVGPGGEVYLGNAFRQGESVPGAVTPDRRNNVECVYVQEPEPGPYRIRVRAYRVPEDARRDTPEVDQDFALVVSGRFLPPGIGALRLDRGAYTAPDEVGIRLFDGDLAGQPSVSIRVSSTTEPGGELVVLSAADGLGSFTGRVATVTGLAASDGRLQVAHGDEIVARYWDASAGEERVATARVDLVPPRISGVQTRVEYGVVWVSWSVDEPVLGRVRFGTNAALDRLAVSEDWSMTPAVSLGALTPGVTWYFRVEATDEAGNVTVEDRQGGLYTIVVPPAPPVLVVDGYDDPFFGAPPLEGYTDALALAGVPYEVWDIAAQGDPPLEALLAHRAVFWRVGEFTGWTPAQGLLVSNYLASGGALFVASMDLLTRNVETLGPTFNRDVLHVESFDEDATVPFLVGLGDPVGEGIDLALDYSVYEELWFGFISDISDTLVPAADAVPVLGDGMGGVVALRWPRQPGPGDGRLVFASFPLDAVPMGSGSNDRVQLIRNVLRFLAPGAEGLVTLTVDRPAYTLPSLMRIELGDATLRGQGNVAVRVESSRDAVGLTVDLVESVVPGVFVGEVRLVGLSDPAGPGTLRVADGDTLTVWYRDGVSGRELSASARVDTRAPVVSGVTHEPDYVQASIQWETDEPADALVQFGESPLLSRTAYDPTPATTHTVVLSGLRPNTVYYYRVVSRDAAGNMGVDDNGGRLHSFRTLEPLRPPFFDNMDGSTSQWTVFNSEETVGGWERGVPANGHETAAHSPPWAWGTSLQGRSYDYMETFLISPAIFLGGGNTARLTFWHSYDFIPRDELDVWEVGTVYVITNGVGRPVAVAEFGFDAENWNEVEVDLTPFMGNMINVVFAYQMISLALDSHPRPGWLIDDVSITVSQVDPGVLVITNNLMQAECLLSGPIQRRVRGVFEVISNAPPGRYVVEYADVPWYVAPPAQTNELVSGGTVVFVGHYGMVDADGNGLPDAYEVAYFGGVDPRRGWLTDADGDGMSDAAEFIAGTNPTNAASALNVAVELAGSADTLRLVCPSASGHGYRLWVRTLETGWEPATDWVRATGPTVRFNLPLLRDGAARFYRVEARP
nr:S8 family serine peptidase [Limisphaera ngatamarikiensis]